MYCGPKVSPNASQLNIFCIGYAGGWLCIGHADFMTLLSVSSCWVANANAIIGGIWALRRHTRLL